MNDAIQVFTIVDSKKIPYDVPEILAVPVTVGGKPYRSWRARLARPRHMP